jgi:hypothetical protein
MIIEFSCVLSIVLYSFITFIASRVSEGTKPDTSKAVPWLVYLYARWECSSSQHWESCSRGSWRWFNCTQIYLLSGICPLSDMPQKNAAVSVGPKSIGAYPVFCFWMQTYAFSEWSSSFVKYHRVNRNKCWTEKFSCNRRYRNSCWITSVYYVISYCLRHS